MRLSWRIRSLTMRVSSIFRYMLLTSSRLSPSVSCRARAVTVILAMVSRTSGATVRSALVHRVTKRVRGRVGAADPTRHALAGEPLRQTTRGRDRRGARALRHEMSFYQQQPHRGVELVVAHEHEVIEEDRERRGRDAGDQIRLVPRVHVPRAGRSGAPFAFFARIVVVIAVLDDRRAADTHRRDLQRVRALRDEDRDRHAEHAAGVRERLAVVAGRRAHDARLGGRITADEVQAAADLERRRRKEALALEPDVETQCGAHRVAPDERRRGEIRPEEVARREHVGEGRCARPLGPPRRYASLRLPHSTAASASIQRPSAMRSRSAKIVMSATTGPKMITNANWPTARPRVTAPSQRLTTSVSHHSLPSVHHHMARTKSAASASSGAALVPIPIATTTVPMIVPSTAPLSRTLA